LTREQIRCPEFAGYFATVVRLSHWSAKIGAMRGLRASLED
jgi:hypothetical protein